MFCLECGLPIDPAPFDNRKAVRRRIGVTEKIKRFCKFLFESRTKR